MAREKGKTVGEMGGGRQPAVLGCKNPLVRVQTVRLVARDVSSVRFPVPHEARGGFFARANKGGAVKHIIQAVTSPGVG